VELVVSFVFVEEYLHARNKQDNETILAFYKSLRVSMYLIEKNYVLEVEELLAACHVKFTVLFHDLTVKFYVFAD
jgi:hypothetical protein